MSYPKLYTAMITPFTEDLEVNYAAAADLAEQLIANGSDGIIVCGTTEKHRHLPPMKSCNYSP